MKLLGQSPTRKLLPLDPESGFARTSGKPMVGRWRKLKGIATVSLPNGALRKVELHWYEAHGIGRKDLKIKRYLEE